MLTFPLFHSQRLRFRCTFLSVLVFRLLWYIYILTHCGCTPSSSAASTALAMLSGGGPDLFQALFVLGTAPATIPVQVHHQLPYQSTASTTPTQSIPATACSVATALCITLIMLKPAVQIITVVVQVTFAAALGVSA